MASKAVEMFPKEKTVFYLDWGRTALKAVIELESLRGSTVILPAFVCQDSFEPIFDAYDLTPRFVDVTLPSFHMDTEEARSYLPDVSALIYVHAFGLPGDVQDLATACDRHDVVLIEDCARAAGARTDDGPVGRAGSHAIYSLSKTTPLSMGGVLATEASEEELDFQPPSYDARALYNALPATVREQLEVTYPLETQGRRLDPLCRLVFQRFVRYNFEERRRNLRRRFEYLQEQLEPVGFSLQPDFDGRVYPTAPTIPSCDRDGLHHYLTSKHVPAKVAWGHPWAKSIVGAGFESEFPNASMLADRLLHVLVEKIDDEQLSEATDHIRWYAEEFGAE